MALRVFVDARCRGDKSYRVLTPFFAKKVANFEKTPYLEFVEHQDCWLSWSFGGKVATLT